LRVELVKAGSEKYQNKESPIGCTTQNDWSWSWYPEEIAKKSF